MSYIFSKIYQILGFDKKIKLHRFIYYINLSFINCLTVQRNRGEWRDNWPTKFDTANPPQFIPNPCATQDSSDLWLLRVGRVGHAPTPFESETHPTCVCVCVFIRVERRYIARRSALPAINLAASDSLDSWF